MATVETVAVKRRTIADASIEMRLLAALLEKAQPDDIVTYEQMEEAAGINPRPGAAGYGKLGSARRRVQADQGIVFVAVAGVGLKRCREQEKPKLMGSVSDRIHRAASKGLKIAQTVDVSQLDNDGVVQFNLRCSQLGVMREFTGAKAVKRITQAVKKAGDQIPLKRTLEATLEAFK